jgi:hypothetical protein
MNELNKSLRRQKEYNKRLGFNMIRDKYKECKNKMNLTNFKGINTEFVNHNKSVKKSSGIRITNINKYERMWIQEVNKIKKN